MQEDPVWKTIRELFRGAERQISRYFLFIEERKKKKAGDAGIFDNTKRAEKVRF